MGAGGDARFGRELSRQMRSRPSLAVLTSGQRSTVMILDGIFTLECCILFSCVTLLLFRHCIHLGRQKKNALKYRVHAFYAPAGSKKIQWLRKSHITTSPTCVTAMPLGSNAP